MNQIDKSVLEKVYILAIAEETYQEMTGQTPDIITIVDNIMAKAEIDLSNRSRICQFIGQNRNK